MTRRARLALIAILLLVVMFSAGLFWFISERVTDRATSEQIEEILALTQSASSDAILTSTAQIGRATDMIVDVQRDGDFEATERAMLHALQLTPELSGTYVAGANGSFQYVFRSGDDGFGTKFVEPATDQTERSVTFTERTKTFDITTEWSDDTDEYDPRTRPWFETASATPGAPIWTEAYTFFTSQLPGVTHAVSDPVDGWVVGVDVELQSLAELLDELSTTTAGDAFLVDYPLALTPEGLVDLTQDETPSDARLRQALEASAADFQGITSDVQIEYKADNGEKHTVGFSPLGLREGEGWLLVTDIAESDVPVAVGTLVDGLQLLGLAISAAAVLAVAGLGFQATRPINVLEQQSKIDSLTALPNRRSILQTGEMASASGRLHAVAMIDVDRFKSVNDTHGHGVGDEVLKGLAQTFLESGCEIGRLGGEEFVMLIKDEDMADPAFVEVLRAAVEMSPIQTSAGPIPITISIGLAKRSEDQSFNQTMRLADGALLEAKLLGRNRLVVVDGSEKRRPLKEDSV